jgi:hypothetical protein
MSAAEADLLDTPRQIVIPELLSHLNFAQTALEKNFVLNVRIICKELQVDLTATIIAPSVGGMTTQISAQRT